MPAPYQQGAIRSIKTVHTAGNMGDHKGRPYIIIVVGRPHARQSAASDRIISRKR
jgi:hypothetical protein